MSFTYPLGLLGLIGIPIVIIIYILRSKYSEQTVSSTYLWTLSEKFIKRRNPLSGLTGIISLVLQILTITAVSLAIAHPVFVLRGSANDYLFMLDSSDSMNMSDGKVTRYDLAKDEIAKIIDSSADGSTYSLYTVAGDSIVIYDHLSDKEQAKELLYEQESSGENVDYTEALSAAQKCFDKNPSALVRFVTDKEYIVHNNLEIITVRHGNEKNVSLSALTYTHLGGVLKGSVNVTSYNVDGEVEVAYYLDGSETPVKTEKLNVASGESRILEFEMELERFSILEARLLTQDSHLSDNDVKIYNAKAENTYGTLIVSDTPFFLEAALDVLLDSGVETVSTSEYEKKLAEGIPYGLYIFHSYTPRSLPDGAVWLVNADGSVDDAGFGVRGKVQPDSPVKLDKSKSTSTTAKQLLDGVLGEEIYLSEYVKYSGMYLNFTTLFEVNSTPVVFAGTNGKGNRQVVFGFDLHKSDFSLSTDFTVFLGNLLKYSFPDVFDKESFVSGEDVSVNIPAGAKNVKAISPSGKEIYVEAYGDVGIFHIDEVGTYTVSMTVLGAEREYRFYSSADVAESAPEINELRFSLAGARMYDKSDGRYDPLIILFIFLALIFIADWGVYCYEKYQLR